MLHCDTCAVFFLMILVSLSGRLTYSKVSTFMKKQANSINMYNSITTSGNKTISLSGNHLIYGRKSSSDKFHPM